jgi:hypothetical protein
MTPSLSFRGGEAEPGTHNRSGSDPKHDGAVSLLSRAMVFMGSGLAAARPPE